MSVLDDETPIAHALAWHRDGHGAALATVVTTWGSAPRPAGSMLAVRGDGVFAGSVSGGCVEGAVVTEARDLIAQGGRTVLEFGVSDDEAWAVGLACGGQIRVLVMAVDADLARALGAISAAVAAGEPAVLMLPIGDAAPSALRGTAVQAHAGAADALTQDRALLIEDSDGARLACPFNPPLRLIIVGAVHIAQPLAAMAALAGYGVTIVDPRGAFASPERFPGVTLVTEWPDEAMASLRPDARTAVVALTHDPKLDDPALAAALTSPAFYVGALGSARTHARRLERLAARGIAEAHRARIHGPVGLSIGARSPAEIAVSIVAQMTAALRQRP